MEGKEGSMGGKESEEGETYKRKLNMITGEKEGMMDEKHRGRRENSKAKRSM